MAGCEESGHDFRMNVGFVMRGEWVLHGVGVWRCARCGMLVRERLDGVSMKGFLEAAFLRGFARGGDAVAGDGSDGLLEALGEIADRRPEMGGGGEEIPMPADVEAGFRRLWEALRRGVGSGKVGGASGAGGAGGRRCFTCRWAFEPRTSPRCVGCEGTRGKPSWEASLVDGEDGVDGVERAAERESSKCGVRSAKLKETAGTDENRGTGLVDYVPSTRELEEAMTERGRVTTVDVVRWMLKGLGIET